MRFLQPQRRSPQSVAVSVALHVVLGAALLRLLAMPLPLAKLSRWFQREKVQIPVERISFLQLPKANAPVTTPGRSGGDGRPERPASHAPAPPLTAPPEVPSAVPPPRQAAPRVDEGGSGPVVGQGGPVAGIRPSFSDPRVWAPSGPVASAPKSPAERLDSSLVARLKAHQDSLALYAHTPSKLERGDWTFEKNGKKYGLDQQWIHLGGVKIPTAVLAALPLGNVQGNPTAIERDRALARMTADIQFQAQRAMNEDEFRKAVRSIRERKERERERAQQDAKHKGTTASAAPDASQE
jgi:hypothetical protein